MLYAESPHKLYKFIKLPPKKIPFFVMSENKSKQAQGMS